MTNFALVYDGTCTLLISSCGALHQKHFLNQANVTINDRCFKRALSIM